MTSQNKTDDPVIREVREVRRQLVQQHGGLAGLAAFLRQAEQTSDQPKAQVRQTNRKVGRRPDGSAVKLS